MVDFRLSEEHEALRQTVQEFARTVIAPVIGDYYSRHAFPYEIISQMGKLGLFGLQFGEECGGMGGDFLAFCVTLEELARVDSSVAITLEAGVGLGTTLISRHGTDDQKRQWLRPLVTGEALAAFALTEPDAGSDAGAITTRAVLDESTDEWVINGSKAFITNSGTDITSVIIVAAVTGAGADGRREISTIVVPAGTAGLTVQPGYAKVGWCASDTHPLSFDDVRVPAANLLGERGRGLAQFLRALDEGRIAIAAVATGLAQGCVDESVTYAGQRRAFGHRIAEFQAMQFMIADMETRVHTARLAYYDAAARLAAGENITRAAAIAKLHASDVAVANARDAAQVHGGYGFMDEFPVGRFWRDAKILEIGEGTSEVQRMVIARQLGLAA